MPRYFFDIDDGSYPDGNGTELADIATAKRQAVVLAGNIVIEAAPTFWDYGQITMTVSDEMGVTLFTLEVIGIDAPATPTAGKVS